MIRPGRSMPAGCRGFRHCLFLVCLLSWATGCAPVATAAVAAGQSLPLEDADLRDVSDAVAPVESTATWMALDAAPDGTFLVFNLLGDIYRLDPDGGQATVLLSGLAWESQPVVSPDGRRIAFVSDLGGDENLWVADIDGGNARALSNRTDNSEFTSPAWAADGASVFVSRIRPDTGAFEIREYDLAGGDGTVVAGPDPDTPRADRVSRVGAEVSPDGRYLYFAARAGFVRSREGFRPWHIHRLDRETGREEPVVTLAGGAVRPVLSPDGHRLVYAGRAGNQTELRIRDLETGADRRLTGPAAADQQTRWATQGLFPRPAFSADGNRVFFADAHGLHRIDLADGSRESVPFQAHQEIRIGPGLRRDVPVETNPVRARLIQAPAPDPAGRRLAFSALGSIYVMVLDGGKPRRLTPPDLPAFHPAWSADENTLAFVSWNADAGGHVWTVAAEGGTARRVSPAPAFWSDPVFDRDGNGLLVLRSPRIERARRKMEYGRFRQAELVRLDSDGNPTVVASGNFGGPAMFIDGSDRIHVHAAGGLESMAPDGGDRRVEFRITGAPYYFQEARDTVQDLRIHADGRHALVVHRSQVYLVRLPDERGEEVVIDLDSRDADVRRITRVGADFAAWSEAGATLGWALGTTWYRRALDSVDFQGGREPRAEDHPDVRVHPALVEMPADQPSGWLVLRGATAITMRGDEVIEDAEVVITGNRITAIGPRGEVDLPPDADVMDLDGRYLIPGLVDAHAHWADVRRGVLDLESYGFLADLAFGVTAGLDVSPLTIDMLAYQDLIEAGRMLGPRVFSTGPAVFSFNRIESLDDARDVLTRYRDHYRVANVKQYRVGPRRQRQWFAQAARELELMPTTEGADNFRLSMTQVLDGFAGVEHSLPVAGLGDDVIRLLAASGVAHVPTLTIADEAAGIGRFLTRDRPHADPRLQRFLPAAVLDEMTRWQPNRRDDLYDYRRHAADARRILEAGGLVAAGSHGEFPGIGMHWEMEALTDGGITAHQALRIATLGSSRAIGRDAHLGSLAPGKLADIVVLENNPLTDIRNSRTVVRVIRNGRVYRAATLEEIWPEERPAPPFRGTAGTGAMSVRR